MDTTSCVARRTRSNTLLHLLENLRKLRKKDDPVEDLQENSEKTSTEKMRDSRGRAYFSAPAKRRQRQKEDVFGVGTVRYGVRDERKHVENDNAGSVSVSPLGMKAKSVEPGRVSDFVLTDGNSDDDVASAPNEVIEIGEEESSEVGAPILTGSDLRSSSFSKIISLDSDGEGSVEKLGTDGEDDNSEDCDVEDEGVESEHSDCWDESSDSSYQQSSEDSSYEDSEDACSEYSAHFSSEDERVEVNAGKNTKSKKRSREKEGRDNLKGIHTKNNLNLLNQLASSIWDTDKFFEKDENSCVEQELDQFAMEDPPILIPKHGCKERKPIKKPRMEKKPVKTSMEDEKSWDEQEIDKCPLESSPLLNPRFGCEEPKPIEVSEEEKELDIMWKEMAFALKSDEIDSARHSKNEDVLGTQAAPFMLCVQGKHDFVIDEEVGLKCFYCSYVAVEIRDISPTMEKYCADVVDYKKNSGRKDGSLFNRLKLDISGGSDSIASLNKTKGTVWECIPGIKETLYLHQQEGFEFIWRNLTGTINLEELKNWGMRERDGCGGCVISHSPGTGKTRLTIVFLQAYLEMFPNSCPVIIAPASMLLTWEEEFKKWNVNAPFHNMNSLEFSGKESTWARSTLGQNMHHRHDKKSIRMVKLFSWCKKKSILGVSYNLFEKLTGGNSVLDKELEKGFGTEHDIEKQEIRKILLEKPKLLVLDEGHTPRNQRSCIWKALSGVKTKSRILLSGTPFQNNFQELSNVLCLTRPAYTEMISSRLKGLGNWSMKREKGNEYEQAGIKELRALISPFVHVHKGSILQESLPGLRDSVVVLKPRFLQKKILDRIDRSQNTFELEHKLSAVAVHPSLFLGTTETRKEEIVIGQSLKRKLEMHKLDPNEGTKTRFLIDFIQFSESINEKVLVFSQYLDSLSLIMKLLSSLLGWVEGREVFFMHGKLEQKERQRMINNFNQPDSESKVLLASTKACSEGINLVGASRVILLDVVWNPSVERQAISRAYRIGQKRIVYTYHLVIKDTPECDKYCKQAEKHRISELVFSSNNERDKLKNARVVQEDKILEEMIFHEKLSDMFEKIIYQPHESDLVERFRAAF